MIAVLPKVELIGYTQFVPPDVPWEPADCDGGDAIAEFAGRACYQSWSRPNPATATNQGYLAHILEVGHYSVLEHGSASFYLTGVSRSFTHELVRHRHLSYSQLSQRYVDSKDANIVIPPELVDDSISEDMIQQAMATAVRTYEALVEQMQINLSETGVAGTEARKRARQAARAVLPNMTETRIVVTGNHRAWRHFLDLRATAAADTEIRQVAILIYWELDRLAPGIYQDYRLIELFDGTHALEREGKAG